MGEEAHRGLRWPGAGGGVKHPSLGTKEAGRLPESSIGPVSTQAVWFHSNYSTL